MDRRRRLRKRSERGAVAVEAALVTPILLILVFGIIEMGFLMKDDIALTSAVRNGGRIGWRWGYWRSSSWLEYWGCSFDIAWLCSSSRRTIGSTCSESTNMAAHLY